MSSHYLLLVDHFKKRCLERGMRSWLCALWLACMVIPGASTADTDWSELSLEELVGTPVSLASRTEEALFDIPAAVAVISREEILRSGATSIPAALRLAPGMQVARLDASKWAVTTRGTGFRFENELLVLVDGRSVYSPLFSGVYWEIQNLPLEDVEQIEVIRGPGATLWGANAYSGVINIITRGAEQTQGGLLMLGLGTEERDFEGARYGGRLGEGGYYRIYATRFTRDASIDWSGDRAHDGWNGGRGGFRADWTREEGEQLTLQGDLYGVELANEMTVFDREPPFVQALIDTAHLSGGYLLGCWVRRFSPTADLKLQFYFDRTRHREGYLTQRHHIYDLDFQHRFGWRGRHEVIWGAQTRRVDDRLADDSFLISLSPDSRSVAHYSLFVQDDIDLAHGRLRLILGSKLERSPFTGLEVQPNVRLLWRMRPRQVVWMAFSRAVRTPSRAEMDGALVVDAMTTGPAPVFVIGEGAEDIASERLTAFEVGYRLRPVPRLFLDMTAYLHLRREGLDAELGTPFSVTDPPPAYAVVPAILGNSVEEENFGLEVLANWKFRSEWSLQTAYTLLEYERKQTDSASLAVSDSPRHRLTLHLQGELMKGWHLDGIARYAGGLPEQKIESYLDLDARVGWRVAKGIEVSLVGQNLMQRRHPEAVGSIVSYQPTQVERGGYAKIRWEF